MKNYHAILFALVAVVVTLATSGCNLSPEEIECGFTSATSEPITAGETECVRLNSLGDSRAIPMEASLCAAKNTPACVVLRPGETAELVHPIDNEGVGAVGIRREEIGQDGECPSACGDP